MTQRHLKLRISRPCTPRTNGKAELFIQIAVHVLLHARTYRDSTEK